MNQFTAIYSGNGELINNIKYYDGFMGQRVGAISCLAFHPHWVCICTQGRGRRGRGQGDAGTWQYRGSCRNSRGAWGLEATREGRGNSGQAGGAIAWPRPTISPQGAPGLPLPMSENGMKPDLLGS